MTEQPIAPAGVDEQIGERVHEAMWRARVTQTQVAQALGIDAAAVSRRLRGRTAWKVTEVIEVARLLRVDVAELFPAGATSRQLGVPPAVTREDVVAEFRCTPAPAQGKARRRARSRWGQDRVNVA